MVIGDAGGLLREPSVGRDLVAEHGEVGDGTKREVDVARADGPRQRRAQVVNLAFDAVAPVALVRSSQPGTRVARELSEELGMAAGDGFDLSRGLELFPRVIPHRLEQTVS